MTNLEKEGFTKAPFKLYKGFEQAPEIYLDLDEIMEQHPCFYSGNLNGINPGLIQINENLLVAIELKLDALNQDYSRSMPFETIPLYLIVLNQLVKFQFAEAFKLPPDWEKTHVEEEAHELSTNTYFLTSSKAAPSCYDIKNSKLSKFLRDRFVILYFVDFLKMIDYQIFRARI